uniref:Uncharacterized protein n=1 Tax=Anguilla anguilla TaxID=7936 RepID=A0A0E9V8L3_ANGAN
MQRQKPLLESRHISLLQKAG